MRRPFARRLAALVVLGLVPIATLGVAAGPAGAAAFTVDTVADENGPATDCTDTPGDGTDCSLREAFKAADANAEADTITVDPALSGQTIALTSPISIDDADGIAVMGNGILITGGTGGSGIGNSGSGLLTLQGLTFTGGDASFAAIFWVGPVDLVDAHVDDSLGNGIEAAAVTLTDSTVNGNGGTGVLARGTVDLTDSNVDGNEGSGIHALLAVTLTRSTANGNDGNGISIFTLSEPIASVTIDLRLSSVSGNGSSGISGSKDTLVDVGWSTVAGNDGAGIEATTVWVSNSTVSDNTGWCGILAAESVVLRYATVVGNGRVGERGESCGNIWTGALTSSTSVVALPEADVNCVFTGDGPATTSQGYNFDDDGSCGFDQPTDHPDAGDPLLRALADYGGPTPTREPLPSSPLVDAIPTDACEAVAIDLQTDQRLLPRPSPPQGRCDIGAVELQQSPPVLQPTFTG